MVPEFVVLLEVLVGQYFFSFKNSGFWTSHPHLLLGVMVVSSSMVPMVEEEFNKCLKKMKGFLSNQRSHLRPDQRTIKISFKEDVLQVNLSFKAIRQSP